MFRETIFMILFYLVDLVDFTQICLKCRTGNVGLFYKRYYFISVYLMSLINFSALNNEKTFNK
jgi:hypothetical protein